VDVIEEFNRACLRGVTLALEACRAEAIRQSSGPYSQADLNRMDNPYARRHGRPLLDPATINVQSGQFRSAWAVSSVVMQLGQISGELRNDDFVADFMARGTRFMFARPIQRELEDYLAVEMESRIAAELERWGAQEYRL